MENKKLGMSIFIIGAIIMFAAVMYGNGLQDDLRSYSLEDFATKYGVAGQLRFFSFAFGFCGHFRGLSGLGKVNTCE